MATALSTFSAFSLNNRPAMLETNRNGAANIGGVALPATVGQHWIPSLDNTYDLGQNSTPLRWRDIWLSRNASVVGSVTAGSLTVAGGSTFTAGPVAIGGYGLVNYNGNTPSIGTNGSGRWGALYITNINCTQTLYAGATSVTSLAVTGVANSSFYGPIFPGSAGTIDIGSNGLPWKDLYITGNIYKNGVLYNPGVINLGDLLPAADNVYNIGSFPLRWKSGYFGTSLVANQFQATDIIANSITCDAGLTCNSSVTVGGSMVIGAGGPATLYCDNASSTLGQSWSPWQTSWVTTTRSNVVMPMTDPGTVDPAGSKAVAGSKLGSTTSSYENAYLYQTYTSALYPWGSLNTIGSSGGRWSSAWFNFSNTNYMTFRDSFRSGYESCIGTDDTAYDNTPIVRGVVDGTALKLSGVKSSSATSNGVAYPNVVQWCSRFALAVYVQKLALGDYWVTIQSQYNATTQNAEPNKRGLPRINGTYNATTGNPRALPVINVTPYYFPQTRADQGAAMDSKMYMCVTDVRMVGDDATGLLPNTPDGSYWQFRVKTSTGKDAVFAFTVYSGFHGQYKNATTDGGAITIAYDYDADYYTDYVNNLTYNAEQPLRGAYRTRMQAMLGNPANKLYSDATGVAAFVVGEFVPFLP